MQVDLDSTTPSYDYSSRKRGWGAATLFWRSDLIERIEVELDRKARARLWRRLQEIYADELPAIPLYFRAEPYVLPKWLKGLEPTGHQDISTLWVERCRAE